MSLSCSPRPGKATLKDVARRAGTSIATASVVLSQSTGKYVSDELRVRVLEAARYYNYRPNISARRMKGKNGRSLAILVPQFENFFFNRIVIGAENYANSKEYILSIYSTLDEEDKEIIGYPPCSGTLMPLVAWPFYPYASCR